MGYTRSDFSNRSARAERKALEGEAQPIDLPYIFFWGFIFSLTVVFGLIWVAAAYETKEWIFWRAEPRLEPDRFFAVIRNAVTAAAALGVGVTLFFSYRRQQTAERTLRISAEAQRTAAEAQKTGVEVQKTSAAAQETANRNFELANRNFELVSRKHDLDIVASLRARYAQCAEQLASKETAVRLAGLYALSALADDWFDRDDTAEQQTCLDLFCSVIQIESQGDAYDPARPSAIQRAGWQILSARWQKDVEKRKYWGNRSLNLEGVSAIQPISNALISNNGMLILKDATLEDNTFFSEVELDGGALILQGAKVNRPGGFFSMMDCKFGSGLLFFETLHESFKTMHFSNCNFSGAMGATFIHHEKISFTFDNCVFSGGRFGLLFHSLIKSREANSLRVSFINCTFEDQVFNIDYDGDESHLKVDFDEQCIFSGKALPMSKNPAQAIREK
ncbi:hypothetical protein [Arthrobacter agilis]|uniref:hypothetical protein n=1 Tax=Arthrobacter agilis TaxID=37921 RepID=UPI00278BAB08|nr:hypothetical protein [Arthrobacter agilis]MDQ0735160.1 hypothetical protein [Arthrobacter agilis]